MVDPNANFLYNCHASLSAYINPASMAGLEADVMVGLYAEGRVEVPLDLPLPPEGEVRWSLRTQTETAKVEVWDTEEGRRAALWRALLRATTQPVGEPPLDGRGDRKVAVLAATPEGVVVEEVCEPPRRLRRDLARAEKALKAAVQRTAYYRR